MVQKQKCIVIDIDGTICPIKTAGERYEDLQPYTDIVTLLREYREAGFHLILTTSRNMRTYEGNIGQILAKTAPVVMAWLAKHDIPYDEIHFGKPWPGSGGFYVDDRAIRPSEFRRLSYQQITQLLTNEQTTPVA
jgi:capsule biosynthesis phosphatase